MCVLLYLFVPRPVSVCRNNYEIIYVGHVTDRRVGVQREAWKLADIAYFLAHSFGYAYYAGSN